MIDPGANRVGKARRDHPDTSKAAAYAIEPRSGTARMEVLKAIAAWPRTDEELQYHLGMPPNTQRPRRVELEQGGWIKDSGNRRQNQSGQWAIVWCLSESSTNKMVQIIIREGLEREHDAHTDS